MDNATYRRSVFTTLSGKPAKAGLRRLASNTARTNLFHGVVGMNTEVGELFGALEPYLGGHQITADMKTHALEEVGDYVYYVFVCAKVLKVKIPGAGKKVKLKGMTRTEALLGLLRHTTNLLDLSKKAFYGPATYPVTVEGSDKVKMKIDVEGTEKQENERKEKMRVELAACIDLVWALSYDLFNEPPALIMAANRAKLAARYPQGFFDHLDAHKRDLKKEKEAAAAAIEGKSTGAATGMTAG